jgi:tyrosine-protein kinase Etk/Wzc
MPKRTEISGSYAGDAANEGSSVRSDIEIAATAGREMDWLDLLLVLSRYNRPIILVTVLTAVLAAIVAFLLPKMYTATTTILPPQESQSTAASLVGQIGMFNGLAGTDLGLKNPSDLFTTMLKSRSVQHAIVDQFNLRRVYGVKLDEDARKKLNQRSDISDDDQGIITISVSDHDPKRAADMANAYVNQLRLLNQTLGVSEAARQRLFYQQKMDAEREELSKAELALSQAQEKTGLVQPDAQGRAIIEAVATTRAQVALAEVQMQAMRTYATPSNPDLQRKEQELAGLRAELAKLERSSGSLGNGQVEIPTRRLPEVELDYLRRSRDLKYHEALYEFLNKQLEAARIDEAKEAIVVQVIDKAVVPGKKSGPKRMLIVLVSTLLAFFLSCAWGLVVEVFRRKRQDPYEAARLEMIRSAWQSSSPKA